MTASNSSGESVLSSVLRADLIVNCPARSFLHLINLCTTETN